MVSPPLVDLLFGRLFSFRRESPLPFLKRTPSCRPVSFFSFFAQSPFCFFPFRPRLFVVFFFILVKVLAPPLRSSLPSLPLFNARSPPLKLTKFAPSEGPPRMGRPFVFLFPCQSIILFLQQNQGNFFFFSKNGGPFLLQEDLLTFFLSGLFQ